MKRLTTIISIASLSLLFASNASASSQNNATDLIYGNSNVKSSKSSAFVAAPRVQNNLMHDLVYGGQKLTPTRGEAPERFVDNRDNNTDIIYGS